MKMLNRILKSEEGLALPMALVLLVVGVAFVIPGLSLVATTLTYNQVVEGNTRELYSADAGVEQVLWKFWNEDLSTLKLLPINGSTPNEYLPNTLIDVNGMSEVYTNITNKGERIYQIRSTATNARNGHQTTVDCYIYLWNLSEITDGAVTSNGALKIERSYIYGGVYYNCDAADPQCVIFGNNYDAPPPLGIKIEEGHPSYPQRHTTYYWPTVEELSDIYDNCGAINYNSDKIDMSTQSGLFNTYLRTQGNLEIDCKTNLTTPITLHDTLGVGAALYVNGDLTFKAGSKDYILDLNDQTIFVTGQIYGGSHALNIEGNGAIISGGKLDLKPAFNSEVEQIIFMMSVRDELIVLPQPQSRAVHGCVLGYTKVTVQNGWIDFMEPSADTGYFPDDRPMIMTYEIKTP